MSTLLVERSKSNQLIRFGTFTSATEFVTMTSAQYSAVLSTEVRRAYYSTPGPARQEAQSSLRLQYLALFRSGLNIRETLIATARELTMAVNVIPAIGTRDVEEVVISCGGEPQKFKIAEHPVVLVGRHSCCDLMVHTHQPDFSRVSAVIFLYPRQVLVINPGNLRGNHRVDGVSNENEPVINLSAETNTNLRVCGQLLTIGQDENLCCICYNAPRSQRLSCGHVTCEICFGNLGEPKQCPFCRKERVAAHDSAQAVMSYVPQV